MSPKSSASAATPEAAALPPGDRFRLRGWLAFGVLALVLCAAFASPLAGWIRFAAGDDLSSYTLLVPVISAYLAWQRRRELSDSGLPARWLALVLALMGGTVLGGAAWARNQGWNPGAEDAASVATAGVSLLLAAAAAFTLGRTTLRRLAFPLGFLAFVIPLPSTLAAVLEHWLQHGSAEVTNLFYTVSFMPFIRRGLIFELSDISIRVAPECSGIHSSLVLLVTSVLASYLFLNRGWRRAVLVAAVVPLALLRNGFRIWVIGELCVHLGPDMIDSPIHHQGGPIFFALSLIPFLYLLRVLRRGERPSPAP